MKVQALALAISLAGCGPSDKKPEPAEAPSLSSDGKQKVPPGYETTYKFGDREVKLEYTWVSISPINGLPAYTIYAQGSGMGMLIMSAPIPEHTPTFASLAGGSTPAFSTAVKFPGGTVGNGADIKITEVTPAYVRGSFTTQACKQDQPKCDEPTNVAGTFKAYRSALSDDAMFERVYVKKQ